MEQHDYPWLLDVVHTKDVPMRPKGSNQDSKVMKMAPTWYKPGGIMRWLPKVRALTTLILPRLARKTHSSYMLAFLPRLLAAPAFPWFLATPVTPACLFLRLLFHAVFFYTSPTHAPTHLYTHIATPLSSQVDYLVYLDMDLVVKDPSVDFTGKYVGVPVLAPIEPSAKGSAGGPTSLAIPDLVVTDHNKALNNGAFVLRNSPWAKKFLARWAKISSTKFPFPFTDNGSFIETILSFLPNYGDSNHKCMRSGIKAGDYLECATSFIEPVLGKFAGGHSDRVLRTEDGGVVRFVSPANGFNSHEWNGHRPGQGWDKGACFAPGMFILHTKEWGAEVPKASTQCPTALTAPLTTAAGEHLYGKGWGVCTLGSGPGALPCQARLPVRSGSAYNSPPSSSSFSSSSSSSSSSGSVSGGGFEGEGGGLLGAAAADRAFHERLNSAAAGLGAEAAVRAAKEAAAVSAKARAAARAEVDTAGQTAKATAKLSAKVAARLAAAARAKAIAAARDAGLPEPPPPVLGDFDGGEGGALPAPPSFADDGAKEPEEPEDDDRGEGEAGLEGTGHKRHRGKETHHKANGMDSVLAQAAKAEKHKASKASQHRHGKPAGVKGGGGGRGDDDGAATGGILDPNHPGAAEGRAGGAAEVAPGLAGDALSAALGFDGGSGGERGPGRKHRRDEAPRRCSSLAPLSSVPPFGPHDLYGVVAVPKTATTSLTELLTQAGLSAACGAVLWQEGGTGSNCPKAHQTTVALAPPKLKLTDERGKTKKFGHLLHADYAEVLRAWAARGHVVLSPEAAAAAAAGGGGTAAAAAAAGGGAASNVPLAGVPRLRTAIVLRDPYSRLYSAYMHGKNMKLRAQVSPADKPNLVKGESDRQRMDRWRTFFWSYRDYNDTVLLAANEAPTFEAFAGIPGLPTHNQQTRMLAGGPHVSLPVDQRSLGRALGRLCAVECVGVLDDLAPLVACVSRQLSKHRAGAAAAGGAKHGHVATLSLPSTNSIEKHHGSRARSLSPLAVAAIARNSWADDALHKRARDLVQNRPS